MRHPQGVFCSRGLLFSSCSHTPSQKKTEQSEMKGQEVSGWWERSCGAAHEPAKVAEGNRDLVHRVVWFPTVNSWGCVGTGHERGREMAFISLLEKIKVPSATPSPPLPHPREGRGTSGTPRTKPAPGMAESGRTLQKSSAGRCGTAFSWGMQLILFPQGKKQQTNSTDLV